MKKILALTVESTSKVTMVEEYLKLQKAIGLPLPANWALGCLENIKIPSIKFPEGFEEIGEKLLQMAAVTAFSARRCAGRGVPTLTDYDTTYILHALLEQFAKSEDGQKFKLIIANTEGEKDHSSGLQRGSSYGVGPETLYLTVDPLDNTKGIAGDPKASACTAFRVSREPQDPVSDLMSAFIFHVTPLVPQDVTLNEDPRAIAENINSVATKLGTAATELGIVFMDRPFQNKFIVDELAQTGISLTVTYSNGNIDFTDGNWRETDGRYQQNNVSVIIDGNLSAAVLPDVHIVVGNSGATEAAILGSEVSFPLSKTMRDECPPEKCDPLLREIYEAKQDPQGKGPKLYGKYSVHEKRSLSAIGKTAENHLTSRPPSIGIMIVSEVPFADIYKVHHTVVFDNKTQSDSTLLTLKSGSTQSIEADFEDGDSEMAQLQPADKVAARLTTQKDLLKAAFNTGDFVRAAAIIEAIKSNTYFQFTKADPLLTTTILSLQGFVAECELLIAGITKKEFSLIGHKFEIGLFQPIAQILQQIGK